MYNKNIFRKANDKKLLHKIGKQWITVSIAMLALLGGSALTTHITHADSISTQVTNTSKVNKSINNQSSSNDNLNSQERIQRPQAKTSNKIIQSSASGLHQHLLNKATMDSPIKAMPNDSSQHFNTAYENYLKQNPQLVSAYDNNINNQPKNNQVINPDHNLQANNKANVQTGTYNGLNYKYNPTTYSLEFTSGTINISDLSDFITSSILNSNEYTNIKNVIFDNGINSNKVTNISNMFNDQDLESITFSSTFDTSNVTNMNNLFGYYYPNLKRITVNSSKTKFNSSSSIPLMYIKDGPNYQVNNFSKGDIGTSYIMSDLPSNAIISGNYDGLNYKYYTNNKLLEFINGSVNTSDLIENNSNTYNSLLDAMGYPSVKSIKFDNGINTDKLTNMSDLFKSDQNLQSITFGNSFNTSNVTNMSNMFYGDKSLQSIIFGNSFNTSHVTNMSDLFGGSDSWDNSDRTNNLKSITINSSATKFNSSVNLIHPLFYKNGSDYQVNDFSKGNMGTFMSFSYLPKNIITVGTHDGVTYKYDHNKQSIEFISGKLFGNEPIGEKESDQSQNFLISDALGAIPNQYNSEISPIKYVKFDDGVSTTDLKNIDGMFNGCPNLQSVDFGKSFNVSQVDPSYDTMFSSSDTNLRYIIIESPSTKFTNSAMGIPMYIPHDSSYQLNDFQKGNTGIIYTFKGLPSNALITGIYHGLNYKYYINNQYVEFTGGKLDEANTSHFLNSSDFGIPTYPAEYIAPKVKSVSFDNNVDFSNVTNISNMFTSDFNLQSVKFGTSFNTSHITNMSDMFGSFSNNYDNELHNIIIASPKTKFNNKAIYWDMYGKNKNDSTYQINDFSKGNVGTFYTLQGLPSDALATGIYNGLNYKYTANNQALEFTSGTFNKSDTSGFLNRTQFGGFDNDFNKSDYYQPSLSNNMFLRSVKFDSDTNFNNVNNMSYMFNRDDNLQSIIFPKSFNTKNVTNMSDMFFDDAELQSLALPDSFNTSNVTNMNRMFAGDISLKLLSLPNSFDTRKSEVGSYGNGTSTTSMFAGDAMIDSITLPSNMKMTKDMLYGYGFAGQSSDIKWIEVNLRALPIQASQAIRQELAHEILMKHGSEGTDALAMANHVGSEYPIDPIASVQRLLDDENAVDPMSWASAMSLIQQSKNIENNYIPWAGFNNSNVDNVMFSSDLQPYFSIKNLGLTHLVSPYVPSTQFYLENNDGSTEPKSINLFDGKNHPGTWLKSSISDKHDTIKYHDIYNSVDGLTNPTDKEITGVHPYTLTLNDIPNGWALVNDSGQIIKPSEDKFSHNNSTHTINVAPIYKGMTYRYNQFNHSVTFINGTPNNDLSDFIKLANSDIKNATSITFSSNINTNKVTNMTNMFSNAKCLQSLTIQSHQTKFKDTGLKMYKQLSEKDNSGTSYTLATPNDFSKSNIGTFVSTPNTFDFTSKSNQIINEISHMPAINSSRASNINSVANSNATSASADINSTDISKQKSNDNQLYQQIQSDITKVTQDKSKAQSYAKDIVKDSKIQDVSNALADLNLANNYINNAYNYTKSANNTVSSMNNTIKPNIYNFKNANMTANSIHPASVNTSKAKYIDSVVNNYASSLNSDDNSSAISSEIQADNSNYAQLTSISHDTNYNNGLASSYINDFKCDDKSRNASMASSALSNAESAHQKAEQFANQEESAINKIKNDVIPIHKTAMIPAESTTFSMSTSSLASTTPKVTGITKPRTVSTRHKPALSNHKKSTLICKDHRLYIKIYQPILLHTNIKAVGYVRDYAFRIKPNQHLTLFVSKIIHVGKLTRYVIHYHGHNYFITANKKFVRNSYWQKRDLHAKHYVKVIRNAFEYRHAQYNEHDQIRMWHRGSVLPYKSLRTIAKHQMTRFQLLNSHWITANKNFVKLI